MLGTSWLAAAAWLLDSANFLATWLHAGWQQTQPLGCTSTSYY